MSKNLKYKSPKKKMKLWKKLLIIFLSVFAFVFAVLVFLIQCPATFCSAEKTTYSYSNVMRKALENNPEFMNSSITEIAMLASHDALSYNISYSSKRNIYDHSFDASDFVHTLAKGIEKRLAKAQNHDIYTQLSAGVRWIDARIVLQDGEFYTSHGLISHKLEDSLIQISQFLSKNAGEFVIFQIANTYCSDAEKSTFGEKLLEKIKTSKYNEKSLFDYINFDTTISDVSSITYSDMTSAGTKAGIMILNTSSCTFSGENAEFVSNYTCYSKWQNNSNSAQTIAGIEAFMETTKQKQTSAGGKKCFYINQTQMAPNFAQWKDVIFDWSLLKMAKYHNAKIIETKDIQNWLSVMPIYWCDYVTSTYKDFNKIINEQILTYNSNL